MRGNHPGSFDDAHALAWHGDAPPVFSDTGEDYDLVVVGGGLSGLAAGLLFQQENGPETRILILDNHDDFGGHAKRNEFSSRGKMVLGVGGSINLEHPENYSRAAKRLLRDIGVDLKRLEATNDPSYFLGGGFQKTGMFVETGPDASNIIPGQWFAALHGKADPAPLIDQLPFSPREKDSILKLLNGQWDYLAGYSNRERSEYMASTSYHDFLRDKVGMTDRTLSLFDSTLRLNNGVGGDGISVREALEGGAPGLRSVGWPWAWTERLLVNEDNAYHALLFPDGNASVARLMVRKLIPDVAEGNTMDDIAAARFDYDKLDIAGTSVRLRLNSTAVRVRETGDSVTVSYVESGQAKRVQAKHCILACYNAIIPHLCPELPEAQKEGLLYGSKTPFIWTNVLIREAAPFIRAGADTIECPNSYYCVVTKAPPVKLPDHETPSEPTDPLVVFMMRSPAALKPSGVSVRDHFRATRYELLATSFDQIEAETRAQLREMYASHGFDADRDIQAITVNRWSHGYAYSYHDLDDADFAPGSRPHEIGRQKFGRISIANTDSEARAYLDAAIDAAWRATKEQSF